ncbi:UDP-N-acetylmuramoyl-L-alanine--D-glutamate ligase [Candidatus Woesebacteria bacterium]|nr:UDP-N-acetylmuramoyl-L-alanine--D-glutamate ligase [Candidatus Woesebacteria bacterium]
MQVIIIGLGKEGWSSFSFCLEFLPQETTFVLVDDKKQTELGQQWQSPAVNQLINANRASFFTTEQFLVQTGVMRDQDTVAVVSPGLAPSHELLQWLDRSATYQTSNTQLFFDIALPDRATTSPITPFLPKLATTPTVIGVTGTKGKSTTTAAIEHLLTAAGLPTLLGGNIGTPPLDLVPALQTSDAPEQFVALELSAHQLSRLHTSPQVAVILAITPEHLDYYQNFERYQAAKTALCSFQRGSDTVLFSSENSVAETIAELSPGKKLQFSATNDAADATLANDSILLRGQPLVTFDQLKVIGRHTIANLLPSVLISELLEIPTEKIIAGLASFVGLPHRLQFVTEQDGVRYYNDSLATTPEAAVAALRAFDQQPVILIAGGFDRGLNYASLAQAIIQSSVKAVLLLPTTGEKIAHELSRNYSDELLIDQVPTLTIAVERAKQLAQPGDIVLLSPASASFNQFKDYADRGNQFAEAIGQS